MYKNLKISFAKIYDINKTCRLVTKKYRRFIHLYSLFDAIMSYIFQLVLGFKLHFKPEIQCQPFGLHCMFVCVKSL